MWSADYFVTCDKCGNQQWIDGHNLRSAKKEARSLGWSISATTELCPECRPTPRVPDKAEIDLLSKQLAANHVKMQAAGILNKR